jgi:thiol-disulfide isomerase/thioredoxin
MRRATLFSIRFLGLLVAAGSVALAAGGAPEVRIEVVKYGQLAEAVRAQKGKVVVVDVWATYCIPCKKEFPNLVRLHESDAGKGLVCISVSVDPVAKKEQALKFLTTQKATFTNFLLDEDSDLWTKRWGISSIPAIFVFDREGRRAAKFTDNVSYADVEPVVKGLLASPP